LFGEQTVQTKKSVGVKKNTKKARNPGRRFLRGEIHRSGPKLMEGRGPRWARTIKKNPGKKTKRKNKKQQKKTIKKKRNWDTRLKGRVEKTGNQGKDKNKKKPRKKRENKRKKEKKKHWREESVRKMGPTTPRGLVKRGWGQKKPKFLGRGGCVVVTEGEPKRANIRFRPKEKRKFPESQGKKSSNQGKREKQKKTPENQMLEQNLP